MSGQTATTLAYVRTPAGVVKVDPGKPLPKDVLEDEVERLGDVLVDEQPKSSRGGNQQGPGGGS